MYAFDRASLRRIRTIVIIPLAALTVPRPVATAAHSAWMVARKAGATAYAERASKPFAIGL